MRQELELPDAVGEGGRIARGAMRVRGKCAGVGAMQGCDAVPDRQAAAHVTTRHDAARVGKGGPRGWLVPWVPCSQATFISG